MPATSTMTPVGLLAWKDVRVLARDTRAVVILLAMPLVLIMVLGLALGESFGQKPDDRLRVSVVDLDAGSPAIRPGLIPGEKWSLVVQRDLAQTAGIRVERIADRADAEKLVRRGQRSAVLVFGPEFSRRVERCSFLSDAFLPKDFRPINPFYRDGVNLAELDVEMLRDPTQATASSIIEQVAQVTMLRVVMPWMIGRAFEKVGDPDFMDRLGREVPGWALMPSAMKPGLGEGVKKSISGMFSKYDLTAKNWAALTRSESRQGGELALSEFQPPGGLVQRGAIRYQILVPSYTVMFAFFLVLTVGWLFVTERRQGTMTRLRAAPLSRGQILAGKLVPCFLVSVVQGLFLMLAGKLVFGLNWGPRPELLLLVVLSTSAAAVGLSLLVASLAKTETQVAIYGSLLVLLLAGVSGCLMPRDLMPEQMKQFSRVTPHAWALDAYNQLLVNPSPEIGVVLTACTILWLFGAAFTGLAWWWMNLE